MYTMLQQLNEAVSKAEQKRLMKEWRELSIEKTLFELLFKKMAARTSEIEDVLMPIVRDADNQKEVIDNAIVEYKSRTGVTSYPYSDLWAQALKTVNEDQKAVLEAYQETMKKTGKLSESLKFCDPKMEKILAGVNKDLTIEELKAILVKIAKLPDHQSDADLKEGSILDHLRSAIRALKAVFKPLQVANTKANASAAALMKIAKKKPEAV